MAIELTNKEIVEAIQPLDSLLREKLPVAVSFGIAKTATKLKESAQAFYKTRDGLIKQYNIAIKPSGNGDSSRVIITAESPEDENTFASAFQELMEQKVSIEGLSKVKLPTTVNCTCPKCGVHAVKDMEVEPITILQLSKFIE